MRRIIQLFLLSLLTYICSSSCENSDEIIYKWPTIGISILVRNKAHTLPYFFSCLEKLDYPKDRLYIWIYTDHNKDNSEEIIEKWKANYASDYNNVYITVNNTGGLLHPDEKRSTHWSLEHFRHVMRLRQEALNFARKSWADYLFMVDADVFLTNPLTLKILVQKNFTVVSPMLISDGLYSNFWCGMTENYYYKRTDDYKPILNREKTGCFNVPMVHTAVLVSLRRQESDLLSYDPDDIIEYDGPEDDIIVFAISAKSNGITLNVCNDDLFGFVPVPLEDNDYPSKDYDQIVNIKLEAISASAPLLLDEYFQDYVSYPTPTKYGCSEIYMINLERRTERKYLMDLSFKELGMDAIHYKAVDGRKLDLDSLDDISVTLMPNYEDPYHKRPMKTGEVGCFLSHYYIWEEIVEKRHALTLVLEDDIHFVPHFRQKFYELLHEIKDIDWDLVYIGRKILLDSQEEYETPHTTRPLYSYWTLGYLIKQRGARKLLEAKPLRKMLPVDEFLPIMFDQHPNDTWKSYFPIRNLKALSAAPLLVHPTRYTGQEGYISDTEDSTVVESKPLMEHVKNEL